MASFDVESLFTDIPLQETIELCVQKLFEDKHYIDSLSKDPFREMLTVTITSLLFDVIYKRYVDDTFLLFQNTNQIEKFKYYLNLQHSNIKTVFLLGQIS